MLCYTCYIPAAKQRKWASYGPPISYFLRKMQQFWICVISTLHFILCRKSVEITVFFAASTSAYYRQLPICSLRLQRLKICLEQSSTGSSPVSGTTPSQISFDLRRFFYPLGVLPPEAIQRWLPQMPLCFPHLSGRIYRQLSLCCYDQATPGFASD